MEIDEEELQEFEAIQDPLRERIKDEKIAFNEVSLRNNGLVFDCEVIKTESTKNRKTIKCVNIGGLSTGSHDTNERLVVDMEYACKLSLNSRSIKLPIKEEDENEII